MRERERIMEVERESRERERERRVYRRKATVKKPRMEEEENDERTKIKDSFTSGSSLKKSSDREKEQ